MIKTAKNIVPGLFLVAAITLIALMLSGLPLFHGIIPLSPLILAIIIGLTLNNTIKLPPSAEAGISFAARRILRIAVIFLGFRISVSEIAGAGPLAAGVVLVSSTLTILFTLWLGMRLNIPLKRTLLLASGVSICGASAVAAVEGVVQSEKEDAAFAIGAVTLMGTLYMALYPALYNLIGPDDVSFALWAGSSIHEVAQVAAAGSAIRDASVEPLASTVKMIRVLCIVPLTFILLFFNWKEDRDARGGITKRRISVPWFALLFFAAAIINSLSFLPGTVVRGLIAADNWLMTGAMAGLGLGLSFINLSRIGKKAIVLGVVSSLFISLVSATAIFFGKALFHQ
jgi:uncharacterized integral membrane protein (TIGR00698 family)